jgi:type II secretory pathway pseudopilin PulG
MIVQHRKGLTLVELLVTLGVVLALTALVLPSVKTLLVDRKATQSATIVRNFIEAARARAVGNNNAVSVVLERVSSLPLDVNGDGLLDANDLIGAGSAADPRRFQSATALDPLSAAAPLDTNFAAYNMCVRLSMAERPRPRASTMSGNWTDVDECRILDLRSPGSSDYTSASNFPGAGAHPVAGRVYCVISAPTSRLPIFRSVLTTDLEILAGNEISFGGTVGRYLITETAEEIVAGTYRYWFTCVGSSSADASDELSVPPLTPYGSYKTFVVHPKPRPIVSQSVTLPRGMCVDLSLSGFGEIGNLQPRDRRFRFSSEWLDPSTVPSPHELRPVYLEFGSDGALKTVWANGRGTQRQALVPCQALSDVFLHVGKTDQVRLSEVPTATGVESAPQNLTDASSYVVKVSATSGSIVCAPAAAYTTQSELTGIPPTSVGNILSLTRLGTLGQPLTGQ